MSKEKFKLTPASYLVLREDEKVSMIRRFNTGFMDGYYSLIAGHVDEGETFTQCIIREGQEEAGVSLNQEDLKVVHVMQRHEALDDPDTRERVDVFIEADSWQGEPENMEPHKCDELAWFPLDNLPENTIPYIRHALECIRKKIAYSEFGW